jgi:hypothetical protein
LDRFTIHFVELACMSRRIPEPNLEWSFSMLLSCLPCHPATSSLFMPFQASLWMKDFLRSQNIKISYCSFDEKDLKRRPLSLHTDFAKPG